ncbi:hypothetical protein Aduo_018725 [Ancylostoma duodenale]
MRNRTRRWIVDGLETFEKNLPQEIQPVLLDLFEIDIDLISKYEGTELIGYGHNDLKTEIVVNPEESGKDVRSYGKDDGKQEWTLSSRKSKSAAVPEPDKDISHSKRHPSTAARRYSRI